MKIDISEAKKKIKHLRTSYLAEKKKVDNSKKSGSPVDMIYQPRLFYYTEMAFLDSLVGLKTTNSCSKAGIFIIHKRRSEENIVKMEWCTTDIYKIINLYRKFHCLWNYRRPNYKRADLKNQAWQKIAKAMKIDVCEAKKKIKHLRTAYLVEKKKVDKSKKSGSSVEMIHQPRLFYYTEMAFLNSVVPLRTTTSCLNAEIVESATEALDLDSTLSSETSSIESPSPPINFSPLPLSSTGESSAASSSLSFRKLSSRKSHRDAKFISAVDAIVASATKAEKDYVFTAFAKTIALQLKQLPMVDATETMAEIHSHVTSKVLAHMKVSKPAAQEPNV